jgi:hypothetical protein
MKLYEIVNLRESSTVPVKVTNEYEIDFTQDNMPDFSLERDEIDGLSPDDKLNDIYIFYLKRNTIVQLTNKDKSKHYWKLSGECDIDNVAEMYKNGLMK